MMLLAPVLEAGTTLLIGWLDNFPALKLVSIMVLIPFIFNSIQFWIQDNILKADKKKNIIFVTRGRLMRSQTMKPNRSTAKLSVETKSKNLTLL
jgi:hypothetical protein